MAGSFFAPHTDNDRCCNLFAFTALGIIGLTSFFSGARAGRASIAIMRDIAGSGIVLFLGGTPSRIMERSSSVS